MKQRRNHMFSAGEGSLRATMIDKARHPDADHRLIFTDTLYEDADTYRFLIEAAAFATGRTLDWTIRAEDVPDYRVDESVPIEEYAGNPEFRAYLKDLRERAMAAIPELIWLVEGRDPWEIFRDERFIGNSGVDPCSRVAKREAAAAWRSGACHREGELFGPPDIFTVGIGFDEKHRFFGDAQSIGIRRANAKDGWIYEAPLIDVEIIVNETPSDQLREALPPGALSWLTAPIAHFGLRRPRLYGFGYKHGNCGGFCCKAGLAHWANRFRVQPERFAYDAMMERKLRDYIGADVSMLTDRRGGDRRPMSLDTFEQRLREEPAREYEYQRGESGCGCTGAA